MKKMLSRVASVLLTVTFLVSMCSISAGAEGTSIRFSDPEVLVGENVDVTMTVGSNVAGYDIWLNYDSSLLQYIGDDDRISGGGGSLHIIDFSTQTGTLSIKLSFKTLGVGSAKITVSEQSVSDDNADIISDVICGNSTVTITNPPTASSDSSLKSLSISPGSLSPAFSSKGHDYHVTVPADATKLAITAVTNDDAATYKVTGANSLEVGVNWVTITVTAEDGSTTKYVMKVTREEPVVMPTPTPTPAPTPTPEVSAPVESQAYVILSDGSTAQVAAEIDESLIPEGFVLGTVTVEGIEVPAIRCSGMDTPAVYLAGGGSVEAGFYFLNESDGSAVPMEKVAGVANALILADVALADIPEGYEIGAFTVGETMRAVLVPSEIETPNHCLIYGINAAGECALYLYDPADGSFQRYNFAEVAEKEPAVEETPAPSLPADDVQKPNDDGNDALVIVLAAAVVILLALTICFAVLYARKGRAGQIQPEEGKVSQTEAAEDADAIYEAVEKAVAKETAQFEFVDMESLDNES